MSQNTNLLFWSWVFRNEKDCLFNTKIMNTSQREHPSVIPFVFPEEKYGQMEKHGTGHCGDT